MPTIDNLPFKEHSDYAHRQKEVDRTQTQIDREVAGPAQIDVAKPEYPQAVTLLGQHEAGMTWATFAPPHDFHGKKTDYFSSQPIPRIPGDEQLANLREQIARAPMPQQLKKILLKWHAMYSEIVKNLHEINANRNRQQRG